MSRGAVGRPLIDALREGEIPRHKLDCVLARPRQSPHLVTEAAGQRPAPEVAPSVLAAGCDLALFSIGTLADAETDAAMQDAAGKPGLDAFC